MSELPAVEGSEDIVDVNESTQRRQYAKWLAIAVTLAIIAGVFFWSQLKSAPRSDHKDDPARILATADAASGAEVSPEATAAELAQRATQLEQELAQQRAQNVELTQRAAAVENQLQADRQDAMRTISALETRTAAPSPPVAAPAVSLGGAAAPAQVSAAPPSSAGFGPNPFTDGGSAGFVGGAPPPPPPPPRRTIGTIRASTTQAATPISNPGSTSLPAARSGGGQASASGSAGQGQGGSPVTGSLQVFDTGKVVPPNSYARAKVLVGVDAAAGVRDSADPKPVVFRIVGPAVSVGVNGRFQETDIRGCMINGAAYGELSSEKVYVKLQRITCPVGQNRHAVGTVEGFVTHKGKAGVRGTVISREGNLTQRAMIAGTLQGLGSGLSANFNRNGAGGVGGGLSGLLGTEKLSASEIAQASVGQGVSNAASMLADYYIKRAEQYQPVIEMPTGVEVELVFLSGIQIKGD